MKPSHSPAARKAVKLNVLNIDSLPPGDYTDHQVPNLVFRPGKKRKPWIIRTDKGRTIVGYYLGRSVKSDDNMGLTAARDVARKMRERIDAGVPVTARPVHPKAGKTLAEAIDAYEAMRRSKGKEIKTLDAALRTVRSNLAAHLPLPARQFTKADLREVRDRIHKRAPQQASRFLAYCGPVWKWMSREDIVDTNVALDVDKIAGIKKRERVLIHAEIAAIWQASFKLEGVTGPRFGAMVRFLLLSGQRRGEAAAMRHGDVLDGTWRQKENKSSRPQRLRLPPLALDQIGSGQAHDRCFPGKGGTEMSGFSKLKADLDDLSGVSDWVLHDLRRTAASELQELGIDLMVIEAVLNHAVAGVAGHYLHATLDRAKGEALQRWADEVQRIVGATMRVVS